MFEWLKRKSTSVPTSATPELDFTDPNPHKFEASLSQWRKSLESKRAGDQKLDQNDLNFMRQDALDDLAAKEAARKKELAAKKRAAKKRADAKPAAKKTTTKTSK